MRTVKRPVALTVTVTEAARPFAAGAKITVPRAGIDSPGGGPPTSLNVPNTTPVLGEALAVPDGVLKHANGNTPASAMAMFEIVFRFTFNLPT
jgi:hypothetical protein